jgi:hypothetical protein
MIRSETAGERFLSLRAVAGVLFLLVMLRAAAQVPPTVTVHPQDQHSCIGGSATFTVAATGTAPFNFTWHSNNVPVFFETMPSNSSFTIVGLQPGNHGDNFYVHVSNPYGMTVSSNANLFVPDPGICQQPTNTVVPPGGTILFNVGASGTPPLNYHWNFEGTPLTNGGDVFGAHSPSLVISNAQTTNTGFYQVVINNSEGSITSVLARCDVAFPPSIFAQPMSRVARFKANTFFNVGANGTPPRFYQWYRNNVPIQNATNSMLMLNDVQRPQVGLYHAIVTNAAGAAISEPAHLQIRLTLSGSASIAREEATDILTSLTNAITLFFVSPPTLVHHGVPLLFTTSGATAEAWETNHCGVTASNSMWLIYYSPRAEMTRVSTEGSEFDTVLSVYTWDGIASNPPVQIACDNDSGYDGVSSLLYFPAESPKDYYIAVDGVNGATGTVRLEVGETIRKPVFTNGTFRFEMAGAYWFDNSLQSSAEVTTSRASWPVLLTMPATNRDWVIAYTNTSALSDVSRYYVVGVNTNSSP